MIWVAMSPDRQRVCAAGTRVATSGSSCLEKTCCMRCAASAFVALDRNSFAGGEYAESFALADVRLSGEAPNDEVILFYAMTGLNVLAPLPGGIHRIVAPSAHAPEAPSMKFVQDILDTRGFGAGRTVVTDVVWGLRFRIHHRVADTYRVGRLLLAGDAALDAYIASRRPIAQEVLTTTGRLTRLATLPTAARPARNGFMRLAAQIPAVRTKLAWQLSGLVYR
jgi:2-polyprenyl-6-methoxyphenol hydroxylase-like FAD-dependent oxidoreductase